ncbi:MAG: YicC/YloC family endoribonuclease [Bacteroidota bacterium]
MIKSMTGYGKTVVSLENKKITIEMKSVNSKQFDLKIRMSSIYNEKEMMIRNFLQNKLERGTIDLNISADINNESSSPNINFQLAKKYYNDYKAFANEVNDSNTDIISLVMRMPEIMKNERPQLDENEWIAIFEGITNSANSLDNYRISEGECLLLDLSNRINNIESGLLNIEKYEVKRIENVKNRIKNNLSEFFSETNFDNNRFEQELIYYIERLDITEEKVRLRSHIDYIREVLSLGESQGKKLSFITQEIGREINTIGSKANDAEMQKTVVEMKDELEKIKEQLSNIL